MVTLNDVLQRIVPRAPLPPGAERLIPGSPLDRIVNPPPVQGPVANNPAVGMSGIDPATRNARFQIRGAERMADIARQRTGASPTSMADVARQRVGVPRTFAPEPSNAPSIGAKFKNFVNQVTRKDLTNVARQRLGIADATVKTAAKETAKAAGKRIGVMGAVGRLSGVAGAVMAGMAIKDQLDDPYSETNAANRAFAADPGIMTGLNVIGENAKSVVPGLRSMNRAVRGARMAAETERTKSAAMAALPTISAGVVTADQARQMEASNMYAPTMMDPVAAVAAAYPNLEFGQLMDAMRVAPTPAVERPAQGKDLAYNRAIAFYDHQTKAVHLMPERTPQEKEAKAAALRDLEAKYVRLVSPELGMFDPQQSPP